MGYNIKATYNGSTIVDSKKVDSSSVVYGGDVIIPSFQGSKVLNCNGKFMNSNLSFGDKVLLTNGTLAEHPIFVESKISIPRENLAYEFLFENDASDTSGNGVVLNDATLIDGGGITGKCISMRSRASFTSNIMGANDWSTSFWFKTGEPNAKWQVWYGQVDIMGRANSCHILANDYSRTLGWVGDHNVGRNVINYGDWGFCDSQWHFCCVVNDYTNGVSKWYLDGVLRQQTGNYTHALFSSTIYFGYVYSGTSPDTTFFDNVRGYRKALTQDEITSLYEEFD